MKMKKLLKCVLVSMMLMTLLVGCGKSEAAQTTDDLIMAIGEVTLESESAITSAQNSYDLLSAEEKEQVENYTVLQSAIIKLDELKEEFEKTNLVGTWKGYLANYELIYVFKEDGTYNSSAGGVKGKPGTYEFDGTNITMNVNGKISVVPAVKSGDTLVMTSNNGTNLVDITFTRQ